MLVLRKIFFYEFWYSNFVDLADSNDLMFPKVSEENCAILQKTQKLILRNTARQWRRSKCLVTSYFSLLSLQGCSLYEVVHLFAIYTVITLGKNLSAKLWWTSSGIRFQSSSSTSNSDSDQLVLATVALGHNKCV